MANDNFLSDDFLDMEGDGDLMSSNDDESRDLFGLDETPSNVVSQPASNFSNDFLDTDEDEEEEEEDINDDDEIIPVKTEEPQVRSRPRQRNNSGSFKSRINRQSRHTIDNNPIPEPEVEEDSNDVDYEEENDSAVEPIVPLDGYEDENEDEVIPVEEESPIKRNSTDTTDPVNNGVSFDLIRKILSAFIFCTHFKKGQIDMMYKFMKAMAIMKKLEFSVDDNSDNETKITAIIKTAIDLDDDVRTSVHNLIEARNMDDSDRAFFLVGLEDRKKLDDIHVIMRTFSLVNNTDLPKDESFNNLAKMVDNNIKKQFIPNQNAVEMISTIDKLLQKTKDINGDSNDSKTD